MQDAARAEELRRPDSASVLGGVREAIASLSSAYFGLVMGAGIVSIAAHLFGMPWIALALFGFNIGAYLVLWLPICCGSSYIRADYSAT
jgi:hypothetical protein